MEFSIDAINSYLRQYVKSNPIIVDWIWSDFYSVAQRLAWDLLNAISEQTHEHIPDSAIWVEPSKTRNKRFIQYDIYLDGDFLWRDSLFQPKVEKAVKYITGWKSVAARNGKYGTDNWVQMFEKGWHAKDYVYGTIVDDHGFRRRICSQKDREGSHALRDAVDRFNRSYSYLGAVAELHSDYI